jgi:beta-galactosidase
LSIHVPHTGTRLDILVENTGRVNFGRQFLHERAGITHQVTLADNPLTGWQVYPLPMQNVTSIAYKSSPCSGACFYQATFRVREPADTFIDTRSLGKGEVFVNGQPLGRFWNIGPEGTLYMPGPWLKRGRNEIVVFDLTGQANPTISFLAHSVLGETAK